jgi:hypothetical protein
VLVAMLKWFRISGSNSVVESQPSKLLVAGPIPVSRSKDSGTYNSRSLGFLLNARGLKALRLFSQAR